jgi:hypothetical protein
LYRRLPQREVVFSSGQGLRHQSRMLL